jgi:hypothetical protein
MKVKSQSDIKKNYEQSTAIVTDRYKTGVSGASWKDAAKDGQDLFVQMMQDPNVLARRIKGIDRVSDEEWRTNTINKGSGVIAARMKNASGKQASRFEPYRNALESMDLPARTADPATNVANRVTPIAVKFREIKNEQG